MDRLILLRHGKAEPDSTSGDDFDRRLAARGEQESSEMGARLADMGFAPDLALVSPAARARGTWEHAGAHFPNAQSRFDDGLYHADSAAIRHAVDKAAGEARTLIVVGHNPGLQELTVQLLQEADASPSLIARAQRNFPTATAAVFLFDHDGKPHYDALYFPDRHH
ncbi:histidine phosphatase family protein [uncultured Phenylobacterium sp.]|uniref:SixA phosphatase family protein n=1 Tax=uncultured Phenylobacterium sp. TaxID=349273 RepID=UPI0025CD337E|nr:histidine phosphatase family protein [uncultured Phenylobacterium sp.]